MLKQTFITALFAFGLLNAANATDLPILNPHCGTFQHRHYLSAAFYYFGDQYMTYRDLNRFKQSIQHLDVLTYSVAYINKNSVLKLRHVTAHNLYVISSWLKKNHLHTRLFLAIGHWKSKPAYRILLEPKIRQRFINSIISFLKKNHYHITGINYDWENEFAKDLPPGTKDFSTVVQQTRAALSKNHLNNICFTVDLPAMVRYAIRYPKPKHWIKYVNWANVMAYMMYGNSPYTELDGALGPIHAKFGGKAPARATAWIEKIMRYYTKAGIPKRKLLLGLGYYADVYYIHQAGEAHQFGLRQKAIASKPVINMSYSTIWHQYGNATHTKNNASSHYYQFNTPANIKGSRAYWLLTKVSDIPHLAKAYAFISYQDPKAIKKIMQYNMHQGFLGMTAWALGNDLPFENKASLLRAQVMTMNNDIKKHAKFDSMHYHQ